MNPFVFNLTPEILYTFPQLSESTHRHDGIYEGCHFNDTARVAPKSDFSPFSVHFQQSFLYLLSTLLYHNFVYLSIDIAKFICKVFINKLKDLTIYYTYWLIEYSHLEYE